MLGFRQNELWERTSSQSSEASDPDLSCPLTEAPWLLLMRSAKSAARGSEAGSFFCDGKGWGGALNFCMAGSCLTKGPRTRCTSS